MKLSEAFSKIRKTIPLLVSTAENYAKDGKIGLDERKPLVKSWIEIIASQFGVRLTWWQWWIISFLIDVISKRLPSKDITVPVTIKF